MDSDRLSYGTPSLSDAETLLALGTGTLLLLVGASRRFAIGALLAVSSAPLLYRGITGHWPSVLNGLTEPDNTKGALGGDAWRARARIDSAGSATRRGLRVLASFGEPAAIHELPRPRDRDCRTANRTGWRSGQPDWP